MDQTDVGAGRGGSVGTIGFGLHHSAKYSFDLSIVNTGRKLSIVTREAKSAQACCVF